MHIHVSWLSWRVIHPSIEKSVSIFRQFRIVLTQFFFSHPGSTQYSLKHPGSNVWLIFPIQKGSCAPTMEAADTPRSPDTPKLVEGSDVGPHLRQPGKFQTAPRPYRLHRFIEISQFIYRYLMIFLVIISVISNILEKDVVIIPDILVG